MARWVTGGRMLLALLLWATLSPRAGAQELTQWRADESFSGGKQADLRLDKPVRFWRAGLSLAEIFEGVEQQTGVKIGFSPADDQNRRVRVHLFLNEQTPPTLRELMAQVAWVVDCPFSISEEGGAKRYFLLGTTVGRGAAEALQAEAGRDQRAAEAQRLALTEKVTELGEALQLPREEAIRRYRGTDDRMLLNVIDPAQRGAAQIVSSSLPPALEQMRSAPAGAGGGIGMGLVGLSPEGQAAYVAAFGVTEAEFQDPMLSPGISLGTQGEIRLLAPSRIGGAGGLTPARRFSADSYLVLDPRPGAALNPEEELRLRRALREPVDEARVKAEVERRNAELAEAAKVKASGATLSSRASELLARTTLPLSGRQPGWRIAEEAARATGLHVICDGLQYTTARLTPGPALAALEAVGQRRTQQGLRKQEWEWGDAGSFLRLRTTNRDVWRAAMLPEAVLEWVDAQVRPLLPPAGAKEVRFTLPADLASWSQALGRLEPMQVQYGGQVLCGDPHDVREVARHAVLEEVPPVPPLLPMLRFLGTLTPGQWEALRAGKLRGPQDLTPEQVRLYQESPMGGELPQDGSGVRLSLGEMEPDEQGRLQVVTSQRSDRSRGMTGTGMFMFSGGRGPWHRLTITPEQGEAREVPLLPKAFSVEASVPRG